MGFSRLAHEGDERIPADGQLLYSVLLEPVHAPDYLRLFGGDSDSEDVLYQNGYREYARPADKILARGVAAVGSLGGIVLPKSARLFIDLDAVFIAALGYLFCKLLFSVCGESAEHHIVRRRPNSAVPVAAVIFVVRVIRGERGDAVRAVEFIFIL